MEVLGSNYSGQYHFLFIRIHNLLLKLLIPTHVLFVPYHPPCLHRPTNDQPPTSTNHTITMKSGHLLLLILNCIALSIIYITSWAQCNRGLFDEANIDDAPQTSSLYGGRLRLVTTGDDDGDDYDEDDVQDETNELSASDSISHVVADLSDPEKHHDFEPSFLQWDATPVIIPDNWKFVTPKACKNTTDPTFDKSPRNGKIIVHFHMQHNAGTNFYAAIKQFVPCATRACWQHQKHCLVSYNEKIEAENMRYNYKQYGVQYVSVELMLPPKLSLPFVSREAREGLYFTTIVRDPFRRFLTYLRHTNKAGTVDGPNGHFWRDFKEKQDLYAGDNLNVRWLSGAREAITKDHINIAKCRLQLFDLVILDVFYDHALKRVLCPMNGWVGKKYCDQELAAEEHKSNKADPLQGVDKSFVGAWVERLRPSFEIYDYAKLLSLKQLKDQGVTELPIVSEVPLYMETMAKYTGTDVTKQFSSIPKVNLQNMHLFEPPREFCNNMRSVWSNGDDIVPDVYGIGAIKKSWSPKSPPSGIVKFVDPRN